MASGISAPLATRMLADLGADVIKIERSNGDPLRSAGPFGPADPPGADGGLFAYVNSNKRSLVSGRNVDVIKGLLAEADLLVEDLGPGRLEAAGLAPEELRQVNPRLAVVRLSDFGQTGPYADVAATGLTIQATAGWIKPRGWPASDPVQVGGAFEEYVAASYLATAALTALVGSRRSGAGVDADVSRLEAVHSTLTAPTVTKSVLDQLGKGDSMEPLLGVKKCADGWVGVNVLTQAQWVQLCELLELGQYADERERLRQGGEDRALFEAKVEDWTRVHTVEDVVAQCQRLRIPAVPVHDGDLILRSAQWRERPFFSTKARRDGGVVHPSFPWRFSETPAATYRPAPLLGEHTAEITETGWLPRASLPAVPQDGGDLPLAGVRVLDLGTFWAGAGCTEYLGAMGADVIKVESIQRPDGWRFNMASPELGDQWYERGRYRSVNLNKRDITLDLASDDGRRLFARLLETADVVLENYSAHVVEKFGFGWGEVRAINPRAVMIRMPGFGLEGPWRDYVGFGPSFIYASGHTALTGFADGPPLNPGGQMDPLVAMSGAFAAMAALESRAHTGLGQLVEVCQIEVGACLAPEPIIRYAMTGEVMGRLGNRSATQAPQGVYRAEDGRWVALSVRDVHDWHALARVARWPVEPALDEVGERLARHDELDERLSVWVGSLPHEVVVAELRRLGVPVATVARTSDHLTDPQLAARCFFEEVDHAVVGPDLYPGWPMRFSPLPSRAHRLPSPLLGEHNEEVLGGELGLDPAELARLTDAGVIGTVPR